MKYFFDGGLGNQLFQIAHLLKLGNRNFENIEYSTQFLRNRGLLLSPITKRILENFQIKEVAVSHQRYIHFVFRSMDKFGFKNLFCFHTDVGKIYNDKTIFVSSYFQHIDFEELKRYNPFILFPAKNIHQDKCFIHIRGGDYLTNKNQKIYCKLRSEYYLKAIHLMIDKYEIKKFKIFTNDIELSSEILEDLNLDKVSIDFSENKSGEDDFLEMAEYRYGILSNSTFSFWAALSNDIDNKKIIAPREWYVNMEYPKFINKEWKIKN